MVKKKMTGETQNAWILWTATNPDRVRTWGVIFDMDGVLIDKEKETIFREILLADFPGMDGSAELIVALHETGAALANRFLGIA